MWIVVTVIAVVVVGFGVWAVVRSGQPGGLWPRDRAREHLAQHLARGEITPEEYQEHVQHRG